MKILALESSGLVASVAVYRDGCLMGEFSTNFKKTHSQTLLPMLDQLVKMLGMDLSELDAVAVSGGPGSFTGLRIGSATAKGLGLALNIPLISVPTVDSLAYNLYGNEQVICPMMDAKRQQVYTGLYTFEDGHMKVLASQKPMDVRDMLCAINELGRPVIFLGDGVPVYETVIQELCKVEFSFAPPHLNRQRAGALASLAALYYKNGQIQTADEHKPDYLRLSQAERELAEKQAAASAGEAGK